jgi:hypothetical protein
MDRLEAAAAGPQLLDLRRELHTPEAADSDRHSGVDLVDAVAVSTSSGAATASASTLMSTAATRRHESVVPLLEHAGHTAVAVDLSVAAVG